MKLYNSLSQKLETFTPNRQNEVSMYVCGITPYDTTHLGHAFTYMAFDVLQRFLKHEGYAVTYVQNVTDIDDDILKRAKRDDQDWKELGNFWTQKFLTDIKLLHIQMPNNYVKATEAIPKIIEIVKALVANGSAYENKGNVYFSIKSDKEYGKLSKYSRKQMLKLSKERGANPEDPLKKDPLDFILWQRSLQDEPYWESPWGHGRPGWHIECSAMIYKYLGKNIDIHGGGSDLIYPHHESEIAQSEQFTGVKPFVKYWMHTGAVSYQGEKMSKSIGNLIMISDLLKKYDANTIRYLLLSHHYREPWEFKAEQLHRAENKIVNFNTFITTSVEGDNIENSADILKQFQSAMANDLDTPQALLAMERTIMRKDIKNFKIMSTILGFRF
jgi:L-cysteine:1D-myo-inositol 2-amino-2-deoxy-alpha-D-glucopyranoside ligase